MRIVRTIERVFGRLPPFVLAVLISGVILSPMAFTLPLDDLFAEPQFIKKDQARIVSELEPAGVAYAVHPWMSGNIPSTRLNGLTRLYDDEPIVPTPIQTIT